jgi:hypothetical protein
MNQLPYLDACPLGVDVVMWMVGGKTLVLAENLDYASALMDIKTLDLEVGVKIQQVVISGADASAVIWGNGGEFRECGAWGPVKNLGGRIPENPYHDLSVPLV